jgi:serine/threonine-protein kinase RsbW
MNVSLSENADLLAPFHLDVRSGSEAARDALDGLKSGLAPLALDIEEIGTIELVMAEALNNIVEHAYPEPDNDGPIAIGCTHRHDGLHMTILDQGNPMPDGQAPIGMMQDVDVDAMDMPEGGFGWFLIQNLAKDVRYVRVDDQNRLELRLALAICRPPKSTSAGPQSSAPQ